MNNSPTYKRNAALLAKHYGEESQSEVDSEAEKQYSPRDRNFQAPQGGEGGQSFQKMLERYENNTNSRISYETTLHDIYGEGASSRESSRPKNPLRSKANEQILDKKAKKRHRMDEDEKEELKHSDEFVRRGLEDYFYNDYDDSGVDFDLLHKNANNRKEVHSEGQSLTLTNLHESFHKLHENLFADEHGDWNGMSGQKDENSEIYAVEEFITAQNENRKNPFQENQRGTASMHNKREHQNDQMQLSKPTQQLGSEIPFKVIAESLNTKKVEALQLQLKQEQQQQPGYSSPNREIGPKLSKQKSQKTIGIGSQASLAVTAKTLKSDIDTKKIAELLQKSKTLRTSPSEVNLRIDALAKNLVYNAPVQPQTHRQLSSQPMSIHSPKKTPSSVQKSQNPRKVTRELKPSGTDAVKSHFKFPSEFSEEKTRQMLADISKNGPASRLSKESLATTTSINKQSQPSSNFKANIIDPSLPNGKNPGVAMSSEPNTKEKESHGLKASNPNKPENSSESRSNPSTRAGATPVTSFKEQNTHSQHQTRGNANIQATIAKKLNKNRVISNEGLSSSNTLSAINQYLLSSANSLNSSKSNQDSLTSPERLFSTIGGKIERTEGLLSYPESKTQSRPSTSNKGSFKGSTKKEVPAQKADRPLSTRVQTSGDIPSKLQTTASTTALKGPEVLAKGKNDNKMKLDLGQIKKKASLNNQESEENNPGFWSSRSAKAGYEDLDSNRSYPTKTEETLYVRNSASKENLGKGFQKPNAQDKGTAKLIAGKGPNYLSQEQLQLEMKYRDVLLRSSLFKQASQTAANYNDAKKGNSLVPSEKRVGTPLAVSNGTKKTLKAKK